MVIGQRINCPSYVVLGNHGLILRPRKIAEHPYEYLVDFLVGQTLPKRYRVVSLLGKNRFFAVYKAIYEPVDQVVILRLFRTNSCRDEYMYRRFQQEVRRLSSLSHRNVAAVMDFGVLDEGLPYIISEYLPGSNLQQILQSVKRISVDRTIFVGTHVSQALEHAHEHGVFHEMLQPSKIFVVRDKEHGDIIKVTDFGLIPLLSKLGLNLSDPLEQAEAIGAAHYMSPEQCSGRESDGKTDLYSLGCVLYQCIGGQPPFLSADNNEIIRMHKHAKYPPLQYLNNDANIPKPLVDVVDKCLMKDPTLRYQMAHDVGEDILNRRSPDELDKLIPEFKSNAVSRASARVHEVSSSPALPLMKVTAIFAAVVILGLACWGLLNFVSKFANEGTWDGAIKNARKHYAERKFTDGYEQATEALREAEKFAQPDPRVAVTLNEVAAGQIALGSYAEAADSLNRAIEIEKGTASSDSRTKARSQELLAQAQLGRGDFNNGEVFARRAIELWQQVSNSKESEALPAHITLIRSLIAQDRMADAKAAYDVAKSLAASDTDISEQVSGELRQCLAALTLAEGDSATAERTLKELLSTRQQKFGLKDPLAAETMLMLAQVYRQEKMQEESIAVILNAFGILKSTYGEEAPKTAAVPGILAQVQEEAGELPEAEKNYRLCLEMNEKIWGARSPHMVPPIDALGKFLRRRGSPHAAEVYETEIKEIQAIQQKSAAAKPASGQ